MNQPDFFIAAAPRSGTTSIFNYLSQHPQIQMSRKKEPAFFHFTYPPPAFETLARTHGAAHLSESVFHYEQTRARAVTDRSAYENLWTDVPGIDLRGEATPTYLYDASALRNLSHSYPEAKMVLVLRDPVDRAYSQYLQYLRHGFESINDFEAALACEPVEVPDFWWGQRRYLRMGLYSEHVERCLSLFPAANVGVFLHEELAVDPQGVMGDIARFLGINAPYQFDTSAHYKSAFVPAPTLAVRMARNEGKMKAAARMVLPDRVRNRLYRRIMYRRGLNPPPLLAETRKRLTQFFRADIRDLETLLDRDLSRWTRD